MIYLDKSRYIVLILAAGDSIRLGRPKQLVRWKNTNLLNHTVQEAKKVVGSDVVVILGDPSFDIDETISNDIQIFFNTNWKKGMGNSIAFGINNISSSKYHGIIVSVCDQPFISGKVFQNLIEAHSLQNKSIIASKYNDTAFGPPTLFGPKYNSMLKGLKGDSGAKKIILENKDDVGYVDFPKGEIDIDTSQDLKKFMNQVK